MCKDHNKIKRGISLKNKNLHHQDHEAWTRRNFLQTLGLYGGGAMALGGMNVTAVAANAKISALLNSGIEDRVLVLVRLSGGNDGLNTIIPLYDYSAYSAERGDLAVGANNYTTLVPDEYAMHSNMNALQDLWEEGSMKVINAVGYDNHNLSHFASSDIMASGKQDFATNADKSGWLGRYILENNPDYLENLPEIPGAIKINSGSSGNFYNPGQIDLAVNFNDIGRLENIAESGFVYDVNNLPDDCYYGDQVKFMRSLLNVTYTYAQPISEAYTTGLNTVQFPDSNLGRTMALVSRLIKGNLGTKLYMVTLGGFDTHEFQNGNPNNPNDGHPGLLKILSDAMAAFYKDLETDNKDQEVLSLTISEFGRRLNANFSQGTDHGTAAPMMAFGPALNGSGIIGEKSDLSDLDNNGNPKHHTDFRSVYATILENWLCLDPIGVDSILGDDYSRLDDLGLDCVGVNTFDTPLVQKVTHSIRPDGAGAMILEYNLDRPGNTVVEVFTMLGQKITTLANGYHVAGNHQKRFHSKDFGLSQIPLLYRISVKGKVYSDKFIMGV